MGERVEGQLWFRGPSTTQGYYRNEAATAALLPEGAAAGWVNSGDRAYRAEGEIYITGRVKDIIIHAGHNLYPHEIEDAVARVPGVRKGCVVAFGAADPVAGTERLVIVAESRERNRDARARLAQAITAQVTETLGLPPNVVEVVPPNAIPKTSSGKLRRDATKQRFLSGELRSDAPPVWLQVARLAAASSAGRIRAALRRAARSGVRMLRHRDVCRVAVSRVAVRAAFAVAKECGARHDGGAARVLESCGMARARRRPRASAGKRAAHVRRQSHQLRGYCRAHGGARHGLPFRRQGGSDVHAVFPHVSSQARPFLVSPRRFAARDCSRRNKSRRRCGAANPFLFFRKEPSPRNPACVHFISARSKRPSRRSARSCPSLSTERGACCATAPGCRAADASPSRSARRSLLRLRRKIGNKSCACATRPGKSLLVSRTNLSCNFFLGGQPLHKNRASQFTSVVFSDGLGTLREFSPSRSNGSVGIR